MSEPEAAPIAEIVALDPVKIRATMARGGIAPMQLPPWWSPDTERQVDPLADPEIRAEVRRFVGWLWNQCLTAEASHKSGVRT